MSNFTTLHPRIADAILQIDDLTSLNAIDDPQLGDSRFVVSEDAVYVYASGGWAVVAGSFGSVPFKTTVSGTNFIVGPSSQDGVQLTIAGVSFDLAEQTISAFTPGLLGFTVGEFYSGVLYFNPSSGIIEKLTTNSSFATSSAALLAVPKAPVGSYPIINYTAEVASTNAINSVKFQVVPSLSSLNPNTYYEYFSGGLLRTDSISFYDQFNNAGGAGMTLAGTDLYIFKDDFFSAPITKIDTSVVGELTEVDTGAFSSLQQRHAAAYDSVNDLIYEFFLDTFGIPNSLQYASYELNPQVQHFATGEISGFDTSISEGVAGAAYDPSRQIFYILHYESGSSFFGIQAIDSAGLIGTSFLTGIDKYSDFGGTPDLTYDATNDRLWIRSQQTQHAVQLSGGGLLTAPAYTRGAPEIALDFVDPINDPEVQVAGSSFLVNEVATITNLVLEEDIRPILDETMKVGRQPTLLAEYTHTDPTSVFGSLRIEGDLVLNALLVCEGDLYVSGNITGTGNFDVKGDVTILGSTSLQVNNLNFNVGGNISTLGNNTFHIDNSGTAINPTFDVGGLWLAGGNINLIGAPGTSGRGYAVTCKGIHATNNFVVSGGSGTAGQPGGRAGSLFVSGPAYSGGQFAAIGGPGSDTGGVGGVGGSITIRGTCTAAGGISVAGGSARTDTAGPGGNINITGNLHGAGGTIDVSGGTSTSGGWASGGSIAVQGNIHISSGLIRLSANNANGASNPTGTPNSASLTVRGDIFAGTLIAEGVSGASGGSVNSIFISGDLNLTDRLTVRGGNSSGTGSGGTVFSFTIGGNLTTTNAINIRGGNANINIGGPISALTINGKIKCESSVTIRGGDSNSNLGGNLTRALLRQGVVCRFTFDTGGGNGTTAGAIGSSSVSSHLFIGGQSQIGEFRINGTGSQPAFRQVVWGGGPHVIGTWNVVNTNDVFVQVGDSFGFRNVTGPSAQLIIRTFSGTGGTSAVNTDQKIRQDSIANSTLIIGTATGGSAAIWRSVTLT